MVAWTCRVFNRLSLGGQWSSIGKSDKDDDKIEWAYENKYHACVARYTPATSGSYIVITMKTISEYVRDKLGRVQDFYIPTFYRYVLHLERLFTGAGSQLSLLQHSAVRSVDFGNVPSEQAQRQLLVSPLCICFCIIKDGEIGKYFFRTE